MRTDLPNHAPAIRAALTNVRRVCDALGLTARGGRTVIRTPRGLTVCCPSHQENTPSCNVRNGDDGTIAVLCFGCRWSADVLGLIAAARGLSLRSNYREVLLEGALMAGLTDVVDSLERRPARLPDALARPVEAPPSAPQDPPHVREPPRVWPPQGEVAALWTACGAVESDADVAWYLDGRGLDPARVDAGDLARALPVTGALPRWAVCREGSWREAGLRLVVPCWDSAGELRSLRAWRVTDQYPDLPKRLPPSGHKAGGLVLADQFGRAWLRGERAPERICIAEGEPDMLVWSTRVNDPGLAVVGIWSGSWGPEFAAKCPIGSRVDIWSDRDKAGDRYAVDLAKSLSRRCFVHRQTGATT